MKFEEFRNKAIALLRTTIPLSVAEIKREVAATNSAYKWLKKMEANGEVSKTAIGHYYFPDKKRFWCPDTK